MIRLHLAVTVIYVLASAYFDSRLPFGPAPAYAMEMLTGEDGLPAGENEAEEILAIGQAPGELVDETNRLTGLWDQDKLAESADDLFPLVLCSTVRRPMVFGDETDLNMEIYEGDDMIFDPYRERSVDDVARMINYAKWWQDQGVRYGTSWVSKGSKYYDGSKSFHYLKIGGRSDCSWFVYNILKKFGYVSHFVSSTKWGEDPSQYPGAHVIGTDIKKASPGDVICTGKPELGSAHVAIYAGDGYVIECTFGGVLLNKAPKKPRKIVHFDCNPKGD